MILSLDAATKKYGAVKSVTDTPLSPTPQTPTPQKPQSGYLSNIAGQVGNNIKNIPSAFNSAIQGFGDAFANAGTQVRNDVNSFNKQSQSQPSTKGNILGSAKNALKDVGGALSTGVDVAGAIGGAVNQGIGALTSPFIQSTGNVLAEAPGFKEGGQSSQYDEATKFTDALHQKIDAAAKLHPQIAKKLDDAVNIVGAALALQGSPTDLAEGITGAIDVAKGAVKVPKLPNLGGTPPPGADALGSSITNARDALTPMKPAVKTILNETDPALYEKYVAAGQRAVNDPRLNTPLELSGQKAKGVLELVKNDLAETGANKQAITKEVGKFKVGNIVDEARAGIRADTPDLGFTFKEDGSLRRAPGRELRVTSKADFKLLKDVDARLGSLGENPTLQRVDDTIDAVQEMVFKRNSTLGSEKINSEIEGIIKNRIGELNTKLKSVGGADYAGVNDEYSKLLKLRGNLASGLGKDAKSAGSFMKKLFSPADGNTKQLFADIKGRYGVDLAKDATIAKFVMDSVGDVRQMSLLDRQSFSKRGVLNKALDYAAEKIQDPIGKARRIVNSNSTPETINTSSRIMPESVPRRGLFSKLQDMHNETPGKQGGYVKIPDTKPSISPENIAKNLDAVDLKTLRAVLDGKSADAYIKAGPTLEAMGIDKLDPSTQNRFIKEVINLSTKKLPVKKSQTLGRTSKMFNDQVDYPPSNY